MTAVVKTGGVACQLGDVVVVPPVPQAQWKLTDFDILYRLGSGNYGQAYLAAVRACNFIVALKRISLAHIASENVMLQLRREVEIAYHTRHKHLLRTYGYFYDDRDIYLILEPCSRGMLYTELMKVKKFDIRTAAKYVAQLSEALLYLHNHHIIHRDIKPENILIDHNGDLKLADFGWSVHDPQNRRQTSCGTPEYFPPEVVSRQTYDHTADLWCVGVFCYELLYGSTPFFSKDKKIIYQNITSQRYELPAEIPDDAGDLIRRLLKPTGAERMTLRAALQHDFLMNHYYKPRGIQPPTGKRLRDE